MPEHNEATNVGQIVWSVFNHIATRDLYDILALRSEVFVVEQACVFQEVDGRDVLPGNAHAWIRDGELIVAYLRVFPVDDAVLKLSRVVTAHSHRGRGLAAVLIHSALARFSDAQIVIDAQSQLEGWYQQFGFATDGERFLEDQILHTPMRLQR